MHPSASVFFRRINDASSQFIEVFLVKNLRYHIALCVTKKHLKFKSSDAFSI